MKTEWNYTTLADAYLKRPKYAPSTIEDMCRKMRLTKQSKICDIGAGTAHLTLELAPRVSSVVAIEPNDAMRANGILRTSNMPNVSWVEATAENTLQNAHAFNAATFGSSFNVCDQEKALKEVQRIVEKNGWFCCLWNHRNIHDRLQAEIESIIQKYVPNYNYGLRRADQTQVLKDSGLFHSIEKITGIVLHQQSVEDCVEAWRSHATLERQAGSSFAEIISEIEQLLIAQGGETIAVPYDTQCWVAQFK